jgi:transcriptional regulator with XRE-family HTH domain
MSLTVVKDRVKLVVDGAPKTFAESANISLSALYSYMSGRRVPSVAVLYRMAEASGYPMEWFLGGEFNDRSVRLTSSEAR